MLDLPLGLTLDLSEITLIGNREVTVLNHRGVIHYSPDRVVIGISEGQADISGENLVLEYILPQDIRIKGEVNGLKIVKQGESPKGK
jgi:sporulation protein YqfC